MPALHDLAFGRPLLRAKHPAASAEPWPVRRIGHLGSINVRKVAWLLDLLGLDHVVEEAGTVGRPLDSADLLALNPNARMPILVDGDFVL